jgi:ABC-type uncharacterized transport system permease subunit
VPDIVIHALCAAAYAGLAWHFWNTRWRARPAVAAADGLQPWERAGILAPLALHGFLLYTNLFAAPELRFGFAHALSTMFWLAVLFYWVESLFYSLDGVQAPALGLAALAVPLPLLFPGRASGAYASSMEFKVHLVLAMLAYSLFTIALLHATLMALVERRLHRKSSDAAGHLPPLLTLEHSLFRVIGVAFLFLSLTLATGMVLTDTMFGRLLRFNHETVFAVLSWLTFGWLLAGRWFYGWRGRTALRWTIAGFVMMVLANIGTAFVLEVVLKRA